MFSRSCSTVRAPKMGVATADLYRITATLSCPLPGIPQGDV